MEEIPRTAQHSVVNVFYIRSNQSVRVPDLTCLRIWPCLELALPSLESPPENLIWLRVVCVLGKKSGSFSARESSGTSNSLILSSSSSIIPAVHYTL